MQTGKWISVRNWRSFQHYDPSKRIPPWIKNYTELLDTEEYLGLGFRLRGLLHGIWLEYAASRCQLGASPATLGRRLGDDSVRTRDLETLNHAGFIDIVASKTLAEGYQAASASLSVTRTGARSLETEKETEKEQDQQAPKLTTPNGQHADTAEQVRATIAASLAGEDDDIPF